MTSRKELRRLSTAVEGLNTPTATRSTDRRNDREERPGWFLGLVKWWRVKDKRTRYAVARRRSYPIHAYVGPNGGGKTACMLHDTIPSILAGRRILSTVAVLDPRTGEPYWNYVKFEDWDQLLEATHTDVLMDEMVGIANSRSASSLDVRAQNKLMQLRRADVVLRWTAPNWARADKIIREVTQAVTECRGSFPARTRAAVGEERRLWAPKRLFCWTTYDSAEFEEWTAGKRDKAEKNGGVLCREFYYGPGSDVFKAYDTLDSVSIVAGLLDNGHCSIDGLPIPAKFKKTCQGHTDEELLIAEMERRAALGLDVADATV